MPIPSTVETRLPHFCSGFPVIQDHGPTQQNTLPIVQKRSGTGVANPTPFYTPALSALKETIGAPLLIIISDDQHLSRSRAPLLGAAGFEVVTVASTKFKTSQFADRLAVVVLCQTISKEQACIFATSLRKRAAHIRTVRITRNLQLEQTCFHHIFQSPVPPAVLAREAMNLRMAVIEQEHIH